jgi:hypothetical protein
MGETINAEGTELWVERRDEGPDVLLIAGLGDPADACNRSSRGSPTAIG